MSEKIVIDGQNERDDLYLVSHIAQVNNFLWRLRMPNSLQLMLQTSLDHELTPIAKIFSDKSVYWGKNGNYIG